MPSTALLHDVGGNILIPPTVCSVCDFFLPKPTKVKTSKREGFKEHNLLGQKKGAPLFNARVANCESQLEKALDVAGGYSVFLLPSVYLSF